MAVRERLICRSDELVEGGHGVRFTVDRGGRHEPAFAIRFRGLVYAYYNRCGHVPVELDWNAGEFFDTQQLYLICSVHGALYDPENGECLGGRCNGRGLEALTVVERDGDIYLKQEGD